MNGAAELLDIGCGTGAAGVAWATSMHPPPHVTGVDLHPWVLDEAAARRLPPEVTTR